MIQACADSAGGRVGYLAEVRRIRNANEGVTVRLRRAAVSSCLRE
jgi:hypothetical protein